MSVQNWRINESISCCTMPWRFKWSGSIIPHIINSKLDGREMSASWCSRFPARKFPNLPILQVAKCFRIYLATVRERKKICFYYEINTEFSVIQIVNSLVKALVWGLLVLQIIHLIHCCDKLTILWTAGLFVSKESKKDANYSCDLNLMCSIPKRSYKQRTTHCGIHNAYNKR